MSGRLYHPASTPPCVLLSPSAKAIGSRPSGTRDRQTSVRSPKNAWALATLPEAHLRDGARSIQIIREAIAGIGRRDPAFLDTLAAGLAEMGRYEEAERVQLEVLDVLEKAGAPEEVMRDFELHLDSYRSKLPLRDPAV